MAKMPDMARHNRKVSRYLFRSTVHKIITDSGNKRVDQFGKSKTDFLANDSRHPSVRSTILAGNVGLGYTIGAMTSSIFAFFSSGQDI